MAEAGLDFDARDRVVTFVINEGGELSELGVAGRLARRPTAGHLNSNRIRLRELLPLAGDPTFLLNCRSFVVTLLGKKALTALVLGPDPLVRPPLRPQRDAYRDDDRADRPERSYGIRPARPPAATTCWSSFRTTSTPASGR